MGDFPHLDWLTRSYAEKAAKSGKWLDHLQAHGLANACLARGRTEERRRQVYDIENSWYKGKHSLTFDQHQVLTYQHKQALEDFRTVTTANFDSLKSQVEEIGIDVIFSEKSLNFAERFATDGVFPASKKCSDDYLEVSRQVIESSVKVLSDQGMKAPCSFAVICLGPVARGEATPYSELQYAMIVESANNIEYFRKLSVDSCFRVGNFCETPLELFSIPELTAKKEDKDNPPFVDMVELVGYRIDGLTDKTGVIPTGSGQKKGQCLIQTVEGFAQIYRSELMTPSNNGGGNLANLLASSTLIYCSDGGQELYDIFVQARYRFEQGVVRQINSVKQNRIRALTKDVGTFKFLPEFEGFTLPENAGIDVKSDIFMFTASLCADLNTSLILHQKYPWDTLSQLNRLDMLSDENYRYMNILLGLSIYIRTSAYLSLHSQSDKLSIYSPIWNSEASDRYYLPRNLSVFFFCLLVPIKKSVKESLDNGLCNANLIALVKNIDICQTDVMLKVEMLCFICDEPTALAQLRRNVGEDNINDVARFMQVMKKKYDIRSSTTDLDKYVKLAGHLLYWNREYDPAINYLRHIRNKATSKSNEANWIFLIADCMNKKRHYTEAQDLLHDALMKVKLELRCDPRRSLTQFIKNQLEVEKKMSDKAYHCYMVAMSVCSILGNTYRGLGMLNQAMEIIQKALDTLPKIKAKEKDKSKLMFIDSRIWNGNFALGTVYMDMGKYEDALKCFNTALEMLYEKYGKGTEQPDIVHALNNIEICNSEIGR